MRAGPAKAGEAIGGGLRWGWSRGTHR